MDDPSHNPIRVAECVLELLEEGRTSATYKQAVLVALLDLCLEKTRANGSPPDSVTTRELAEKVISLYWPQVRIWSDAEADAKGRILVQNKSGRATEQGGGILALIHDFRRIAEAASGRSASLWSARSQHQTAWEQLVHDVEWTLIEMPLPKLQRIGSHDMPWLYEIPWDDGANKPRRGDVRAYQQGRGGPFQNVVRLRPGVGRALQQLNGLLRPFVLQHWSDQVARMNRLSATRLPEFLFGADREALSPVRAGLLRLQEGRCFYCARAIASAAEVDHFLPWSRHPDNALHNLVVADAACNGDKRDFLASARHVARWRERNGSREGTLADLARGLDWEAGSERILGTARAVYAQVPEDGRLWEASRTFVAPDRGVIERALA